MKKAIIIAIATLSTGVVLSSSLKKSDTAIAKQTTPAIEKTSTTSPNSTKSNSLDVMATAD